MKVRGWRICNFQFAICDLDRKSRDYFPSWTWPGVGIFVSILLWSMLLTGCVSKSKADARARAAFFAGQQQAAQITRQTQLQGPTVTVVGEVRNAMVRWTVDLTLAKAVIAASYYGDT